MTKAASSREICFIKAVLLLCEHGHFFFTISKIIFLNPLLPPPPHYKIKFRPHKNTDPAVPKMNKNLTRKKSHFFNIPSLCFIMLSHPKSVIKAIPWTRTRKTRTAVKLTKVSRRRRAMKIRKNLLRMRIKKRKRKGHT